MDNGDNGASGMHESFLTAGGQYIVQAEDGDETLGISGDSMDGTDKDGEPLREQVYREQNYSHHPRTAQEYSGNDRFLPIANVARIMKNAIPKTGKIAKDAKECVQECVSEFVSFITSEASDRCHQEKRKTINGEDILFAMSTLGFDNYVEPLKLYLQKYREAMKGEKTMSTATVTDCSIEDIDDGSYSNQTLGTNILTDQNNVIYASSYPNQDSLNLLLYNNPS